MERFPVDDTDRELIEAAIEVLQRNWRPGRHTKGAAVRGPSGKIYRGINVEGCAYGPCAEVVALGCALSSGEETVRTVVAVRKRGDRFPVVPPCGTCRQLFVDYASGAFVILADDRGFFKVRVADLLPETYRTTLD